jgi:hypothetical protein
MTIPRAYLRISSALIAASLDRELHFLKISIENPLILSSFSEGKKKKKTRRSASFCTLFMPLSAALAEIT